MRPPKTLQIPPGKQYTADPPRAALAPAGVARPGKNRSPAGPADAAYFDAGYFAEERLGDLRAATRDLSWLLSHGYSGRSALALVGNRYKLRSRQRDAVARCAASEAECEGRSARRLDGDELSGRLIAIDAFNVINTLELALGGGRVLLTRDGCARDLGGVHGNWRRAAQTLPALELVGEHMAALGAEACHWVIDAPVSNSGRLRAAIEELGRRRAWCWSAEIVANADERLIASTAVVASADRDILDRCRTWYSLARAVVCNSLDDAVVLDLGGLRQS